MKIRNFVWPILCLAMIALSGCGGGGTGGTTPEPTQGSNNGGVFPTGGTNPLAAPTKGLLKLATAGAAGTIAGIDMTVNLPAGVTVAADPNTGEVTTGAITVSGAAAGTFGTQKVAVARFTPASTVTPAQLHIVMANVPGFSVGEFATVQFDLATGTALPAADAFTVTDCIAKGLDGLGLSGITAAPASVAGI
jgi:hypothetical protein